MESISRYYMGNGVMIETHLELVHAVLDTLSMESCRIDVSDVRALDLACENDEDVQPYPFWVDACTTCMAAHRRNR